MKNILIVGGGTAGWLTALACNKMFPQSTVTLVASEEIGILGAGEGTTPIFIDFMDWLGIPLSDFIIESGAAIKNANKFTNWTGDGSSYYHGFGAYHNDVSGHLEDSYTYNLNHNSLYYHSIIQKDIDPLVADLPALLCEYGKVPHFYNQNTGISFNPNPLTQFNNVAPFAMSFDAVKVASFLKKTAIGRGIIFKNDKVLKCNIDKNGDIYSLNLESGEQVSCDFVFDCSGFYKVIIGRQYKSKWVDLSKYLTVDSAQPFFIDIDEEIPPFMQSVAMPHGWIWKTPLQHRYGCGYVYDSSYTTKESIKEEIVNWLGYEPKFMKHFSFRAGYYKEPWQNNCIALGVACGFLEPMEATSIWTTVYFLEILASDPAQMIINDKRSKDMFNERFRLWFEEQKDFIYLHYMGGRQDNEFWKYYQDKNNTPENIKTVLEKWEYSLPRYLDYQSKYGDRAFSYSSWFEVCHGLGLINKERVSKSMKLNNWSGYDKYFNEKREKQEIIAQLCITHNEFLKKLGGLNNTKERIV